MRPNQKVLFSLSMIVVVMSMGTFGFRMIEGIELFDAFYFTVVTVFTVGYRELPDLSDAGRMFSVLLIILGVGTLTVNLGFFTQMLVEMKIDELIGRRRVSKDIGHLNGHTVLVGYGRVGKLVCEHLQLKGVKLVVVEHDEELIAELDAKGILAVRGEATDDETLQRAGVDRASRLITAMQSTANNVFVTLSARAMNSEITIIARADQDSSEKKLYMAGATRVIVPHRAGATQIAHAALRPAVVDLIDIAIGSYSHEFAFEEIPVAEGSKIDGLTLSEMNAKYESGIIVVAIKRGDQMQYNPGAKDVISSGDHLIALGPQDKLDRVMDELAQ